MILVVLPTSALDDAERPPFILRQKTLLASLLSDLLELGHHRGPGQRHVSVLVHVVEVLIGILGLVLCPVHDV